jgi:hypothetical protein
MKIKPSILAKALHISTDGLRKQRIRGNSPYEYEIIEGRVFYNTHTLPPSVREWCENFTSKKTRTPHKQNKSPRYWNSIGKRNEIRIRNKQKRLKEDHQAYLSFRMDNGFEDFVKEIVEDEFTLSYLTNTGI